ACYCNLAHPRKSGKAALRPRLSDPLIKRRLGRRQYPTTIRSSCDARAATLQRILKTRGGAQPALRDASDPQDTPRFASSLQATLPRNTRLPVSPARVVRAALDHVHGGW